MRAGLAEFHVRHLLLQRTAGARARLPRLPGKAERRGSGLHLYRTRAEPDHRETQLALRTPVRIADCGADNPGRSRLLGGQSRLKAGCGQNCPPSIYTEEAGGASERASISDWSDRIHRERGGRGAVECGLRRSGAGAVGRSGAHAGSQGPGGAPRRSAGSGESGRGRPQRRCRDSYGAGRGGGYRASGPRRRGSDRPRAVAIQIGDRRAPASLAAGARNADPVIHTALAAAADTGQVDRAAVEAIVRALSQFNRPFIYTSGCWVVGDTGDKVADEDTPLAPTPLVAWRQANEQLVLAAHHGVQGIVLRPAMVYGRGGGLVQSFVQSAREHGAARVIGNGENRWTFVHLDDLAALYVLALRAAAGTLLFAAHGAAIRVRDVAEAASRAAGGDGKVETVPIEEARKTMGPFADALALDQQISGERAQRVLGWRPQAPTVLEELGA